jgi:large subunit ribosomal protein L15
MKKKILKLKKTSQKASVTPQKSFKKKFTKVVVARKGKETVPISKVSLSWLQAPCGSHKRKKILGRGSSSGHGKTSTRGSKGQTSRAGRDFYPGFEGGQTPLIRRFPKRGFTNRFKKEYQILNLSDLNRVKDSNITLELLEEKGLIKNKQQLVKILGEGKIQNPITVWAHAFSKKAAQEIKNAGGKAELL